MKPLPLLDTKFKAEDCSMDALRSRIPSFKANNTEMCTIQKCPFQDELEVHQPCCSTCEHLLTCPYACTISIRWRGKLFQQEMLNHLSPKLAYTGSEICRIFNYPNDFITGELNTMEKENSILVRMKNGKKWYAVPAMISQ